MSKISNLPPAGSLSGSELFEVVQDGNNKRLTFNNIKSKVREVVPGIVQATYTRTYTFPESLTWTVLHPEFPSLTFMEKIMGTNGDRIYAPIRVFNENEFIVEFTEPESGTITVVFYS